MGFSISGGLSNMGGAVAQAAGAAALELQRNELETQKMALADSLAGRRDSEGRQEQAAINEKAAGTEMQFRAGESLLNRAQESSLADKREAGENTRLDTSEKGQDRRAAMSEGATGKRFDQEMQFRVAQAKQAATDKVEQRAIDGAVMAATSTTMEDYITAAGEKATRPVKVFDPDKAASILNKAGYPDLAKPFTAPKAEVKAPAEGATVRQNGHTFKIINGKPVQQD